MPHMACGDIVRVWWGVFTYFCRLLSSESADTDIDIELYRVTVTIRKISIFNNNLIYPYLNQFLLTALFLVEQNINCKNHNKN